MQQGLKDIARQGQAPQSSTTGQTAAAPAVRNADPIGTLMARLKPQLAVALPSAMDPDRVARVALTELRVNAKLAQAALSNPSSFMGSMLKASALGIEIGNGLGHGYLIPFDKYKKGSNGRWEVVGTEIQLIIGYKGMIDLARRSGQIEALYAVEVYGGEQFEVTLGLKGDILHKRSFEVDNDARNVVAVYAVAKLKGGEVQFEVMGRKQIEAIRTRSKSKDDGPWVTDWAEMAKKTVVRRLFKYLPVLIEIKTKTGTRAVSLDAAGNDDGVTIDASTGEIITNPDTSAPGSDEQPPAGSQAHQPGPAQEASTKAKAQESKAGNGPVVPEGPLGKAVAALKAAQSVEVLDEIFIRAESEIPDGDLEALTREYRARKAEIENDMFG